MSRNILLSETALIAEAASMLRDRLPKGWQVDVVSEVKELPQYDGRLTLTSPKGTAITFIVEAKGVTRPSARDLVSQLRAVAPSCNHRAPPTRSPNTQTRRCAASWKTPRSAIWTQLAGLASPAMTPPFWSAWKGRTSRRDPARLEQPPGSMALRLHVLFVVCFKRSRRWVFVSALRSRPAARLRSPS
jgi:hypothetical protein